MRNINLADVKIARDADVGKHHFIVGGHCFYRWHAEPYGMYTAQQFIDAFIEQTEVLCEGGVDGFLIETMMGMNEALCALKAFRAITNKLPVIVSMSYIICRLKTDAGL